MDKRFYWNFDRICNNFLRSVRATLSMSMKESSISSYQFMSQLREGLQSIAVRLVAKAINPEDEMCGRKAH